MCPKNNINNNMVQVIPSPIEHMPIFEQVILCLNEQYVQMNKMFKYIDLMFNEHIQNDMCEECDDKS